MKPVRIVIFAKAPKAGLAKTRLASALGYEGAAAMAQRLLQHTLTQALEAQIGNVELCMSPAQDAAWGSVHIPDKIIRSEQGEGDLGARLARASERVIAQGESVLLIGTDCPGLDAATLRRLANSLRTSDAALIPATDGGYVALALNHFHPALFSDMAWSTDQVANETLRRIQQCSWSVQCLPELHDIDEPSDLAWLPADWITPD